MNSVARTSAGVRSERDLVELVRGIAGQVRAPEIGIGDDAAVVKSDGGWLVLTTDTLVEGTHFAISEHTGWRDVGWKSIASNQSDIAAMGARPSHVMVSLTLRSDLARPDVEALYQGMREALNAFGGQLVGGDTVVSDRVAICVAMTGSATAPESGVDAHSPSILRLDAARPGDSVAVSGTLGDSRGGLELMQTDRTRVGDCEHATRLIDAHNRPEPRVQLGQSLLANGIACATDVSDGLLIDLEKVCIASGTHAVIDLTKLPVSQELVRAFPNDAVNFALTGGEDYELLVAGSGEAIAEVNAGRNQQGQPALQAIGEILADEPTGASTRFGTRIQLVGDTRPDILNGLGAGGWDHLQND